MTPQLAVGRTAQRDQCVAHAFEQHWDYVLMLGTKELRNYHDAEDAAQETFRRFCRSWDSFRGEAGVRTYLVTILRNVCGKIRRSRKRHRETSSLDDQTVLADHTASTVQDRRVLALDTQTVLGRLPAAECDALRHQSMELTYEQIATATGCTRRQVQEDLRKAKANLGANYCPSCAQEERGGWGNGIRHTIHPEYSGYLLCDPCAEHYDSEWNELCRTGAKAE